MQTEEAPIVRIDAQEMILEEPAIVTQEETPLEEAPYEPLPQTQEEIPYTGQEETPFATEEGALTPEQQMFLAKNDVADEMNNNFLLDQSAPLATEQGALTPEQQMFLSKNDVADETDNNFLLDQSPPLPVAQDESIITNESSAQQESNNNIIVEDSYAQDEAENPTLTEELTEEELMNLSDKPSSSPSDKPSSSPTTGNAYGNKKSKIGPWPECVGWHDEDCISYIKSEVEDTIQFAVSKPKTYTVHRIYVAVDEYNVVWNVPCRG